MKMNVSRVLIAFACLPLAHSIADPPASDTQSALTDLDRRVLQTLTGTKDAGPLVLHYDPSSVTAEQVDAAAKANQRGYKDLEKLLEMKYSGRIHIFLYRDGDDLKKQTDADAVAFSCGTCSVHQPHDFVSVHELCHIFALQFPRVPDGVCDIFVYEGLATALAESDQNVPIHAWAAAYGRARRLPPLWEFRWRWPDKTPPNVHPYHVAGSFVGFLVERFGIARVKKWYVNATEAETVFGRSFPQLEHDWRGWLARRKVKSAHERHVLSRLGLLDAHVPERIAKAKFKHIFDGNSLSGLDRQSTKCWKVRDRLLTATHDGPWTDLRAAAPLSNVAAVRVRFRIAGGDAFKITLSPESGPGRELILARWSAYLSCGEGYATSQEAAITDANWHDAVIVITKEGAVAYLDGLRAAECKDPWPPGNCRLGLAIERSTVEVSDFSWLPREAVDD
jgi:hypothetical protein